ncbi:AAA family ATPase [Blautia massiliensis]|jgi:KaiC/GvpD/RAD55 family RecA-like ATPase|uniref:AAA family ATPase n=2 Tax=Lachnospirales TaxID=3085636 RepID=A0A6L8TI11_9FIRM|nr:CHC2 zinc finger domain protein [Blautia sp. KLE 1732]MZL54064.1 AAA family ATPase [Blautia massiliensis (ex Durand et al. 2017)]MZL63521.1 AAA family ATPase [Blautia massiliensis (ex Durand et al. 2017)]
MMKMQYTEEQIARANQTDLVSFLNARGEQLVKSGREYRWKKHDSVTVSGNRWYRHSQNKGGYPVDFVMEFYHATFPEAVKMLIDEEGEGRQKSCLAPSPDFRLSEKSETNETVIKYLTEIRRLEKDLVEEWIAGGNIYEEKKHHNVVFVGRDADGIPRYAHCGGTGGIKYRGDVAGSDKSYGFCHRGEDNQLFVFEAAIDLLSFIQLFPKDWKKRSYLSLGGVSSVALMTFLSERPQITSVFLCLDNDHAGNEACEKLAGEIPDGYRVIRLKPARKDWNEILCDENADRKKVIQETVTMKMQEKEALVPMLCYKDIEQTSVEWLWFPYIPFGKLTIIQGNPGEGKTYFAMMLTAACTNRKLFPNMEDIEPFNVIYQTAEDGMGDTIKPRLVEAGADLSRVMVIDDSEEVLTLSDDRIEKAVRQNHVRLVIIDPVQAFIGADVDMNRANEVRPVFRKLGMIAEKTSCAIVLIGHLNKSSGTQSTYRGLGSIDIMAAVRSLIFIGKVKKDPTTRVLIHEKSSLAPPGETMAFKLGDEEGFRWVGAYEISADELLDGKEGKATETKLERGAKLIQELLVDKNEISIRELDDKAKEQGISGRTMRDVRSRMKNELEYWINEKQENCIRLKV